MQRIHELGVAYTVPAEPREAAKMMASTADPFDVFVAAVRKLGVEVTIVDRTAGVRPKLEKVKAAADV